MSDGMGEQWPNAAPAGTVGIEEEYFLVDPEDGAPLAAIDAVLDTGVEATHEFVQELVEGSTPICRTSAEALDALVHLRGELGRAAASGGSAIAGTGTHAFARPEDLHLTDIERYHDMSLSLPWTWREATTCGMHVHVGVSDPEVAIRACDRLRSYLPVLLALSANSPLWRGRDSGLASVRTVLRRLQPRTGMPPRHGSWTRFRQRMDALAMAGVPDGSWTWWAVRPHATHGTVELRVFDTQSDVRNAHALAMLAAALVGHVERAERDPFTVGDETLLEENWWNAMLGGVRGVHVYEEGGRLRAATLGESAELLVDLLRASLTGDVADRLRALASRPEADQQRADFGAGGSGLAMREVARRTMAAALLAVDR